MFHSPDSIGPNSCRLSSSGEKDGIGSGESTGEESASEISGDESDNKTMFEGGLISEVSSSPISAGVSGLLVRTLSGRREWS
jgi:hypothetical protein